MSTRRMLAAAVILSVALSPGAQMQTRKHSRPRPASTSLVLPPGALLIEGEKPAECTYVVDHADPLFTEQKDGRLVARTFDGWHGKAAGLLCTGVRPSEPYRAAYEFSSGRHSASYVLWVFEQGRAWASPFRWRVDSTEWRTVSTQIHMHNLTGIAGNGPTFCWSRLGEVSVTPGNHRLEIEVTEPRANGIFLLSHDCFVFVPKSGRVDVLPFVAGAAEPTQSSVFLWGDSIPGSEVHDGFPPWMDPYLVKTRRPLGAVVICPGGAYLGIAPIESEPVARMFNAQGFHAFVVRYRVTPHRYPAALMDASRAVRVVRSRAAEWKIDPQRVALCGFSAGGHVAATLGVSFDKIPPVGDALDSVSCRPDALVLGYPVITPQAGNRDVLLNLVGPDPTADMEHLVSLDKHVTDKTPRTFLWHCWDDMVPIEHSLAFAAALRRSKVPYEMHIFHRGGHGLGVGEGSPHVASWTKLCGEWLGEVWGGLVGPGSRGKPKP